MKNFYKIKKNIIFSNEKTKELLIMEEKIINLNNEHEKKIELIRKNEMKLIEHINELQTLNELFFFLLIFLLKQIYISEKKKLIYAKIKHKLI